MHVALTAQLVQATQVTRFPQATQAMRIHLLGRRKPHTELKAWDNEGQEEGPSKKKKEFNQDWWKRHHEQEKRQPEEPKTQDKKDEQQTRQQFDHDGH